MSEYHEADIPCVQIAEPPHMLRDSIDPQRLGELADSIAAEGLHQRIGVRETPHAECFVLIYGHRRYLAHQLLQRLTVAARIYPHDCDELLIAASENLNREQLTPMEEAGAVERFAARGESVAGIARLFRRSPSWVSARLALLRLPEELQRAVHHNEISIAVADLLKDVDNPDYRQSLIDEAIRTGATANAAGVWVAHYRSDPARYAANLATVEEIRSNREKFVLTVHCEGCDEATAYGDTRAMRLCARCDGVLRAAMAAPAS